MRLVANPARVVTHEPEACRGCGDGLVLTPVTAVERREVVDLPEPTPVVAEHRLVERECACCGARTKAATPKGVDAPVVQGPGGLRQTDCERRHEGQGPHAGAHTVTRHPRPAAPAP